MSRRFPYAFLLACLCGCGRIGYEGLPEQREDAGLDGGLVDASNGGTSGPIVAGLSDDFSGSTPCSPWGALGEVGGATGTLDNAQLALTLPAGVVKAFAGCITHMDYTIGGARTFVEVPQVPLSSGAYVLFEAFYGAPGGPAMFQYQQGTLAARMDGTTIGGVPHDPAAHRFWQIRQRDTTTYFETSPDGLAWTELARSNITPQPLQARLQIGTGIYASQTSPLEVRFDNFNRLP